MSGVTIAQIFIDDSSDKTITGVWTFDRDGYGSLALPALNYFPDPANPGEVIWRKDLNRIYRRSDDNTTWNVATADISVPGLTKGSILYYDGTQINSLQPGSDGYVLITHGVGQDPSWQELSVNTAIPVSLVVGGPNAEGTATTLAKSDHIHALPAFGDTAGTFTEGNDSRLSDDRTASGLRTATTVVSISSATAPISGQALVATSSTTATWQTVSGSGSSLSNSAPQNVTKSTASAGTDGYAARSDHKHDITTAAPGTVNIASSSTEGTATSLARSDHSHAFAVASQAQGDLLYYNGSAWARLAAGTDGYYLKTRGSSLDPVWSALPKRITTVEYCLTEDVNNTEKYFYTWKATASAIDSERSGNNGGLQNANTCSPYQVPFNGIIKKAILTVRGVGVQNGSVTYPVTYQTDLFDIGFTAESKTADIDFSISNSYTVGTFSVAATDFKGSTTLNIAVTEGQMLGLKFINGNSASLAGQTRNAFVTLIIEES